MFPFMSRKKDSGRKSDYLVVMNIPAYSARRDAAYDLVASLLVPEIMTFEKERRSKVYQSALKLLGEAMEATHAIAGGMVPEGAVDPYEQYLILLVDTIQASSSMLNHELMLQAEEKDLRYFIGGEFASQAKLTDQIFTQSESDIFKCVCSLMKAAESAIRQFRDKGLRKFGEEDRERYDRAFKEFHSVYSQEEAGRRAEAAAAPPKS
jgi:hypothetical protein